MAFIQGAMISVCHRVPNPFGSGLEHSYSCTGNLLQIEEFSLNFTTLKEQYSTLELVTFQI